MCRSILTEIQSGPEGVGGHQGAQALATLDLSNQ